MKNIDLGIGKHMDFGIGKILVSGSENIDFGMGKILSIISPPSIFYENLKTGCKNDADDLRRK